MDGIASSLPDRSEGHPGAERPKPSFLLQASKRHVAGSTRLDDTSCLHQFQVAAGMETDDPTDNRQAVFVSQRRGHFRQTGLGHGEQQLVVLAARKGEISRFRVAEEGGCRRLEGERVRVEPDDNTAGSSQVPGFAGYSVADVDCAAKS